MGKLPVVTRRRRLVFLGFIIFGAQLVFSSQRAAAAPVVNETAIMIQEGGTDVVDFEISGSNLSGVTATASDSTVTVTPQFPGDASGSLRVSITGDQDCPSWDSCQSTITITGGEGNAGSDTITLYRVDANFQPNVDFSASFTSSTRTTTTVVVAAGPTLSPPIASGIWNFRSSYMKPVRTGESGYDSDPTSCGGFPNDCVYFYDDFPAIATSGATQFVFTGLDAGMSYIPSTTIFGNFGWSNSASFDLSLRQGSPTNSGVPTTSEALVRTLSLNDATVAANQSVTLEASPSNGGGTIRYSVADGTATCAPISGTSLTVYIAGTCVVTASVPASGDYGPATTSATFTFTPVARTLTLAGLTRNVGQSVTLNATKSAGGGTTAYTVVDGTATGCSVSGTTLTTGTAGTCVVTASVPASGQYASATTSATFTFTGLARTVSLSDASHAADQSVSLEATVSAGDGTVTYTVVDGTATGCSVSGTTLTTGTAGTCVVTASVPASGQYASATTSATFTFTEVASDPEPPADLPPTVVPPTTAPVAPDTDNDLREADGRSLNGPEGTFYELEPGTAALLIDDDNDGIASVRDAEYTATEDRISVTTNSDLSLFIASSTSNTTPATAPGSASIAFEQGSEIIARGTGYEPGVKVEVWIASTPRRLGIAVVGSEGEYELRIPVPSDLPVGGHTIQSEGLASDGIPKAVSVGIVVRAEADAVELPVTGRSSSLAVWALWFAVFGCLISSARRRL